MLPSVDAVARGGELSPVVITDAGEKATAAGYRSKRGKAPLIASIEAGEAFGVPGTPYVVVLDADGVVRAKGTANNLEQMEGLVETSQRRIAELSVSRRPEEAVA